MRTLTILSFMTAAAMVLSSKPVLADACLDDAKTSYQECKGDCREDYQLAKDTCSSRDHVCVESCRDTRQVCLQPTLDALDVAIDACQSTLSDAKTACRAQYADGSAELDGCIDQVQVVAFLCRKDARRVAKPGVKTCRTGFKNCVKDNCPASGPTDPAAVRACKADAMAIADTCIDDCVENRQLDKDTCLDRDHVCVEDCRADRQSCRDPLVTERNADVDACNAARDAAFDNCRTLYAAGSPERQTCITQAQVGAFQCRDAARENVRSGLRDCREAFLTCADACPAPPS